MHSYKTITSHHSSSWHHIISALELKFDKLIYCTAIYRSCLFSFLMENTFHECHMIVLTNHWWSDSTRQKTRSWDGSSRITELACLFVRLQLPWLLWDLDLVIYLRGLSWKLKVPEKLEPFWAIGCTSFAVGHAGFDSGLWVSEERQRRRLVGWERVVVVGFMGVHVFGCVCLGVCR